MMSFNPTITTNRSFDVGATAASWASIWPAMSVTTQVNDFRTILAITGSDAAGSSFKLTFPIADGTGTKVIGQGNAGHAQLTFGAQIWVVTNVGYGTLVLDTATATRAVGSFDLTMQGASSSVVPAKRQVVGNFDVTY